MKYEFERYRIPEHRKIVGFLQLLGAAGLIGGYFASPLLSILASSGLSLLMFLGVGIRIKIRDPWLAAMPALSYAILSAYFAINLWSDL
jgi:hypothetical protein